MFIRIPRFFDHPSPGTPQATTDTLREKSQRLPWNATREKVRKSGCLDEIWKWLLRVEVITEYNWTVPKSVHVSMLTKITINWINIRHDWTIEPHGTWTCIPGMVNVTTMKIDRLDWLAIPLWQDHISGVSRTWGTFLILRCSNLWAVWGSANKNH